MILITRPKTEAENLKDRLRDLNIDSHIDSLISFNHYKKKINFQPNHNFIISSIQSVFVIKKNNLNFSQEFKSCNFFVIGERTKNELKNIGAQNIKGTFEDSGRLISYLKNTNRKLPITYLCGSTMNEEFIKELNNLNIKFKINIVYGVQTKKQFSRKTINFIKNHEISSVVLYSSFSTKYFLKLIKEAELGNYVKNIKYFCLSPKIASILKLQNFTYVFHASKPNQESLIKLLKTWRNNTGS